MFSFAEASVLYLQRWAAQFDDLASFSWISLRSVPKWTDMEKSMDYVSTKGFFEIDKSTELFDQFQKCAIYVDEEKIKSWNETKLKADERWAEMFNYFRSNDTDHIQLGKIIQFVFCLPGTTASVERVFSLMNAVWSDEKSQLQVETLKAILITKFNYKMTCSEFYHLIKSDKNILKAIASVEKYNLHL